MRNSRNSCSKFTLTGGAPFDFEQSAGIFDGTKSVLPDILENGIYHRALHVANRLVLVLVSSRGTIRKPTLTLEVHAALDKSKIESLKAMLRIMFASSPDFKKFSTIAKKDRLMRMISKELLGSRPIAPPTLFETLVIGLTEQQISLNATLAIRSRLVAKYGDHTIQWANHPCFPHTESTR